MWYDWAVGFELKHYAALRSCSMLCIFGKLVAKKVGKSIFMFAINSINLRLWLTGTRKTFSTGCQKNTSKKLWYIFKIGQKGQC